MKFETPAQARDEIQARIDMLTDVMTMEVLPLPSLLPPYSCSPPSEDIPPLLPTRRMVLALIRRDLAHQQRRFEFIGGEDQLADTNMLIMAVNDFIFPPQQILE